MVLTGTMPLQHDLDLGSFGQQAISEEEGLIISSIDIVSNWCHDTFIGFDPLALVESFTPVEGITGILVSFLILKKELNQELHGTVGDCYSDFLEDVDTLLQS
ncbi:hypothetical protein Tco_0302896 [Tanacetum coccineum]